jgi:hypothetical protein
MSSSTPVSESAAAPCSQDVSGCEYHAMALFYCLIPINDLLVFRVIDYRSFAGAFFDIRGDSR